MNEKDILAKTYFDTATVYRKQPTEDADNISKLTYQPVHSNVPCALSKKTLKATNQTETSNNIEYEAHLFLDPGVLIKPGDKIIITIAANNESRIMYAGEPLVYSSHQEVPLMRDERA